MNSETVSIWSYADEYAELRPQILSACERVFESGRLIFGEEGAAFEREMAASVGVRHGVGVNSGTDALMIALAALGVTAGDEVVTVPNTAVPTVAAIAALGAKPVFVDVNDRDFLMDVSQVEGAITDRTKAVVPVHLYGQCVDMDPLKAIADRVGLRILEDCAQAQGATYHGRQAGSMGDAAAFSFYPTKVLGAYGDAGMILSDDDAVAGLARSLRFYGMESTYYSERLGWNSRLDEIQAAILRTKMPMLDQWVARRRQIADQYRAGLADTSLTLPSECQYGTHCYYLYVVEHDDRDEMIERLKEHGVMCNISYPWPIHTMRGYSHLGYGEGDFPVAERKAKRIFSLPMYPYMTDEQVDRVIGAVRAAD